MPRLILPHLTELIGHYKGLITLYRKLLDDEFAFAAQVQVPQVATIFDRAADALLPFNRDQVTLAELLALIAYRYGFTGVERVGYGGYSIVVGHRDKYAPRTTQDGLRRVIRFIPDHHVRYVLATDDTSRPFNVHLDDNNEPIRPSDYPLILSDVFLLPRHTTKIIFHTADDGTVATAGGKPAILHCQLLPQVLPLNAPQLDRQKSIDAGLRLEAALATLGVYVADAHGGNGGVLLSTDGKPILRYEQLPDGTTQAQYIPVVLDYGYYAEIGTKTLARILVTRGVTPAMVTTLLHNADEASLAETLSTADDAEWQASLATVIEQSSLTRQQFGRLLLRLSPPPLQSSMWLKHSRQHWQTTKEKTYPPLQDQARLSRLYPVYDEIIFPQRIEEYHLRLSANDT